MVTLIKHAVDVNHSILHLSLVQQSLADCVFMGEENA